MNLKMKIDKCEAGEGPWIGEKGGTWRKEL